jgi:hypothetical protein
VIVGRKKVISRRKTEERSMGERERSGWVNKIFFLKKAVVGVFTIIKNKNNKKI